MTRRGSFLPAVALIIVALAGAARADRVTLKDGTVLEGTVIPQGDSGYWIKMADGQSRVVAKGDVASIASAAAPKAGASGGASLAAARARAEKVEVPMAAVAIWQEFIDHNPTSADLPAAKTEMAKWKKLADDGAMKINDKWVGGAELKDLMTKVTQLTEDAKKLLADHQTLKAIPKLQEAARLYPNSTPINYLLGNLALDEHHYDEAIRYFQVIVHFQPGSAEALSNLGVALAFKLQWEQSIETLQKALEIQDSKEVAQNLIDALSLAPAAVHLNAKVKKAEETARLLGDEYKITAATKTFTLLPPHASAKPDEPAAGSLWSGTGFLISPDGLILTNRHVVKDSKTLMVLNGDKQISADVVAVDDEQDLALIRIKTDGKSAFVHLGRADTPNAGAECTVLGYPLIDRLGADLKVTRGIVSDSRKTDAGEADVMVDAKVNPGNSGGPILDRNGHVMAIVCMKTLSSATEDTYGIGIGAGHIRKFLEKNKITTTPLEGGDAKTTEQIVAEVRGSVVCIMATK